MATIHKNTKILCEKSCGGDMEKMARHQVVFVWMNNDESSHPTRVKKGNDGKTIPPLNDAETKDADEFGSLCASLPWHTVIGPCIATNMTQLTQFWSCQ